jgi:hypothetical protein
VAAATSLRVVVADAGELVEADAAARVGGVDGLVDDLSVDERDDAVAAQAGLNGVLATGLDGERPLDHLGARVAAAAEDDLAEVAASAPGCG